MALNLSPEAQEGLKYLERANPELAASIRKTSQIAGGAATSDVDILDTDVLLSGDELASTPNIPEDTEDVTSGLVDADARTAQVNGAGAIASTVQTVEELRVERLKAAEAAQKAAEQYRTTISEAEGEAAIREESRTEFEVSQKEALVTDQEARVITLQNQISDLQVQKQNDIRQAEGRLTSASQIQLETQRISRDYDRQIANVAANLNAQAAVLQANLGNLSRAQGNVRDAVNAKLRTEENEIARMKAVATTANDWYETLDESTQDYMDNLIEVHETELKNKKDRMETNIDLVQNAWDKGIIYEITGDELADTPSEELAAILGPMIAAKEREDAITDGDGVDKEDPFFGVGTGLTQTDIVGELNTVVNRLNTLSDGPNLLPLEIRQANLISELPSEISKFVEVKVDSVTGNTYYDYNEPNKTQMEEIIETRIRRIRNRLDSDEVKDEVNKSGLSLDNILIIARAGVRGGDSEKNIIAEIKEIAPTVSESTIRRTISMAREEIEPKKESMKEEEKEELFPDKNLFPYGYEKPDIKGTVEEAKSKILNFFK